MNFFSYWRETLYIMIVIYHNAFNRKIFARGALETSQWIAKQKPGLYTYKNFMEDIT